MMFLEYLFMSACPGTVLDAMEIVLSKTGTFPVFTEVIV